MPLRPQLSLKIGESEELPQLLKRAQKLARTCGWKKKVIDKIIEDVMTADDLAEVLKVLSVYFETTY